MKVEVKVRGAGRVQHRCFICGSLIDGDPVFIQRDGLRAAHADCMSKENTNGR